MTHKLSLALAAALCVAAPAAFAASAEPATQAAEPVDLATFHEEAGKLDCKDCHGAVRPRSVTPEQALRTLVAFTVDYQLAHPEFIRLVMTENIHRGQYLAQSTTIRDLNVPAIDGLRQLYDRGVTQGLFRPGIDPVDLHMSISALSVFNVANRHTFSLIFQRDLDAPAAVAARRESIVEMVVRFVRA